jgi:hypothetical protein
MEFLVRVPKLELYENERERWSHINDDYEVRVSVCEEFPYSPYLSIFKADDPKGTKVWSCNMDADQLAQFGEDCIEIGRALRAAWDARGESQS